MVILSQVGFRRDLVGPGVAWCAALSVAPELAEICGRFTANSCHSSSISQASCTSVTPASGLENRPLLAS